MLRNCFAFILLLTCYLGTARAPFMRYGPSDYIELYKNDALKEMFEQGVPASITLGQAMVESDFGNSDLAIYANNHFGLKCHREWIGDTYNYDDDKADECFRKYEHVLDSYLDHSIFIKNRPRYNFLFNLSVTDYRAWANGLKNAGYATHPEYAQKVIAIIEKYRLYELDRNGFISTTDPGIQSWASPTKEKIKEKGADIINTHTAVDFKYGRFVIVKEGDTYAKIAREFSLKLSVLLKYNDHSGKEPIFEGDVIFIEPKKINPGKSYHLVTEGETMKSISQLYGIELKSLYEKNLMKLHDPQPKAGTVLYLRRKKAK